MPSKGCKISRTQGGQTKFWKRVCGCVASCEREKVGRLLPGWWVGWSGLEQLATHHFLFPASFTTPHGTVVPHGTLGPRDRRLLPLPVGCPNGLGGCSA